MQAGFGRLGWVNNASRASKCLRLVCQPSHNVALNGEIVQSLPRRIVALAVTGRCLDCVSAPAAAFSADAISGAVGVRSDSTSFSQR